MLYFQGRSWLRCRYPCPIARFGWFGRLLALPVVISQLSTVYSEHTNAPVYGRLVRIAVHVCGC